MITNENIQKIVNDCKLAGHSIKVGDIAFVLLCERIADPNVAFKISFKSDFTDNEVRHYNNSKAISFLRSYIKSNYGQSDLEIGKNTNKKKSKVEGDITFEENKAEMIKLIEQAERDYADGLIEAKDRLKIVSELRVKLNDKFKVVDDVRDSVVIVETKFNSICSSCGREIYIPTKEDLMKEYNLMEKQ